MNAPRDISRRARYWLGLAEKCGLTPLSRERVERAIAKHEQRRADDRRERADRILADRARLEGCRSVTKVAAESGMTRTALFEYMSREGWLVRADNGNWHPTNSAIAQGFAVTRGPASIRYAQLTPAGRLELIRRFGVATGDTPAD